MLVMRGMRLPHTTKTNSSPSFIHHVRYVRKHACMHLFIPMLDGGTMMNRLCDSFNVNGAMIGVPGTFVRLLCSQSTVSFLPRVLSYVGAVCHTRKRVTGVANEFRK